MYREAVIFGSSWLPERSTAGYQQRSWQYNQHDVPDFWSDKTFTQDIMERYPLTILLTSCPPRYHLDGDRLDPHHGNLSLLRELWRTTPTLHVFNHPSAAGQASLYWSRAQQAYEDAWLGTELQDDHSSKEAFDKDVNLFMRKGKKAPLRLKLLTERDMFDAVRELFSFGDWKDLFIVLVFGFLGLFTHRIGRLRGAKMTKLVNASMQYDEEGEVIGPIQVVQI